MSSEALLKHAPELLAVALLMAIALWRLICVARSRPLMSVPNSRRLLFAGSLLVTAVILGISLFRQILD